MVLYYIHIIQHTKLFYKFLTIPLFKPNKTIMKTLKLFAMLLLIVAIAASCKKEAGPAGPAGANGSNGNANIRMYGYPAITLNVGNGYQVNYSPAGLTSGLIDSSAIFVYYSAGSSQWNMANGLGPDGDYATIQYTNPLPAFVGVYLENGDGTAYSGADVTWDSVRVVIMPANSFRIAEYQNLDFNNYNAVAAYSNAK
jgi:hypothetical protein